MTTAPDLPPLTGSALLDPWRIRRRLELAGELAPPPRRSGETASERVLWQLLVDEPPGWLREYATGPYRLDFFCPLARLAVEVDGGSHAGVAAGRRDALRDAWHAARGITTKRFSATEVEREPDWVLAELRALVGAAPPVVVPVPRPAGEPLPVAGPLPVVPLPADGPLPVVPPASAVARWVDAVVGAFRL